MIVGRLQQRAKRQITAADGDFLEDPVVVPAALQAREAPCGALQQSARLYRGEQNVGLTQPLAGLQRDIGRRAAAAPWDAAFRRQGHRSTPTGLAPANPPRSDCPGAVAQRGAWIVGSRG